MDGHFFKKQYHVHKDFKGKTKIKIKKDSLITINGVKAKLLTDVIVTTDDPDKLMGKDHS